MSGFTIGQNQEKWQNLDFEQLMKNYSQQKDQSEYVVSETNLFQERFSNNQKILFDRSIYPVSDLIDKKNEFMEKLVSLKNLAEDVLTFQDALETAYENSEKKTRLRLTTVDEFCDKTEKMQSVISSLNKTVLNFCQFVDSRQLEEQNIGELSNQIKYEDDSIDYRIQQYLNAQKVEKDNKA